MTEITFIERDGTRQTVTAAPGERLLDVAQGCGQPLEGTCDGAMACSTCHVFLAPEDIAALPPPSEEEEDLLDLAAGATRFSRLACQIFLSPTLPALTVTIPPTGFDFRRN
jgi:ferredoxin